MQPQNLIQIFNNTVKRQPHDPSFRYKENGEWLILDWQEVFAKVLDLTGALHKLGVQKGDRVCLFSHTRYEWALADLAILSCGAVTVPIYESSTPEQAFYILDNCGAKVVFVENDDQFKKIRAFCPKLTSLKQIILFETHEKPTDDGVYTLEEAFLLGAGQGKNVFDKMLEAIRPEDEASYVYTSGTTGPPKGAVLTHGNFLAELTSIEQVVGFERGIESLIFLPLAHILARIVHFAQIYKGFVQNFAESIDKLMDNIAEARPHLMASVPRIFEKVHTRVMQGVESGSATKKAIFFWALKVGEARASYTLKGKTPPLGIQLKWILAHGLVFSKLQKKMGGRLKFFISGGAPLAKEIGDFFHAAGFLILEGYGLTETSAAIAINSKQALKMGTVGRPLPGVEMKIAADGEILARGGVVFKGYYGRPEETSEVLEKDGWFHTGDIGVIDDDGFVKITDRKKDIIVTAAGKNIAPQNIENLIKTDPFISQIMVHGDRRKFLSALVTLDRDQIVSYAKGHQIVFKEYADLVKSDEIHHLIKARIEEKNRQLAKYETIKKFAILENDFSVETGELTPTMKVKRKFTSQKYQDVLDGFYTE